MNALDRVAYHRDYEKTHRETLRVVKRAYVQSHLQETQAYHRAYRDKHRNRLNEQKQTRRLNFSEDQKQAKRQADARYRDQNWEYLHSDEFKRSKNERLRKQYAEDDSRKIEMRLRASLTQAIRIARTKKSQSVFSLVGSSVQDLRKHIQAQFVDGMSWERFSEIHIDHIRPCASFDLTDTEQQSACFHYTNLRPMWQTDNLSKGAIWNGVRIRKRKKQVVSI